MAYERNVVESEVPDAGVNHSVGGECHCGADDGASEDIIPIVELINRERATDQCCAKHRHVRDDQLPVGWVVVAEDLELGVEVEVEEDEAAEGCSCVAGREGFERVVDVVLVAGAYLAVVHDAAETVACLSARGRYCGLADIQEVWSKSSDQPLQEDLEDGCSDETVKKTNDRIVDIPETANSDLHDQEEEDRDQCGEKSCCPNRYYLLTQRVCELRVDDIAIDGVDWEGARRGGRSFVDLNSLISARLNCEVGGILTPRPIMPITVIVTMSGQVDLIH